MANLTFDIVADIKSATKSLKSLENEVSSSFNKISSIATGAFAAIGVSIAGLGFKAVIAEAAEAEKGFIRLEAALKLAGDFTVEANTRFRELAENLSDITGVEDDLIISSFALAKQFNTTNEEAERLVKASLDLSAATGVDLNTAVESLGKTLDGTAGRLAEQIPALRTLTAEQLRAGDAIAIVQERFQGAGEALGDSFGGSVSKLTNSFKDFAKSIGSLFVDNKAVTAFINGLSDGFQFLAKVINDNKVAIVDFVRNALLLLVKVLSDVVDAFDRVIGAGLKFAFNVNPIAGLNAGLKDLKKNLSEVSAASLVNNKELTKGIQNASKSASANRELTKSAVDLAKEQEKAAKEQEKLNKKREEFIKGLSTLTPKGLGQLFGGSFKLDFEASFAGGAGIFSELIKGAEGAKSIVSSVFGGIAEVLAPGIGDSIKQLVGFLAQGPEQVSATIQAFFDALPTIFENIILSIPDLIISIIEGLDEFLVALVDRIPEIIDRLIEKLPELFSAIAAQLPFISIRFASELAAQAPFIAVTFVSELVKEAPRFVTELIKSIGGGIASPVKSVAKGVGGFFGSIGKIFGFAEGGMVPAGFPGDKFPARLSSGEFVIDRSQNEQLQRFLDSQESSRQNQNTVVNLQVGEQQLATVLLNLNRQGFRTA